MEVICFGLGMIIGGALFGTAGYFIARNYKSKEDILEAEERKAEIRMKRQWANIAAYNGTSNGQEDVD
ncbi:MAG: hypothetical protein IKW45_05240 [Clostridia bacterium]|nr:hypothetical protein [Clostridia bacterium]